MLDPIPSGHVGNLTPEEETKLREFWAALFTLVGIHPGQPEILTNGHGPKPTAAEDADVGAETPLAVRSRADNHGSEQKRKKRLGFFGRKKATMDEETDDHTPSPPGSFSDVTSPISPASNTEDKFDLTSEYRKALASQSPESLRATLWSMSKHDHPDALLLRFLRARKWVVNDALVMLIAAMHWRAVEQHVDDDIMKEGEAGALRAAESGDAAVKKEAEDFLKQLRMGKSFLRGVDKEGRPMCFVRVRLHERGMQSESSLERYTVFVIETARFMLIPPVDTACLVFDLTGFSLANMEYAPVKFMVRCFEANYPESLGVVLVHKAPWIFQSIWAIIKGWLDPVVATKVHFTKNLEELEQFVSHNHIPEDLGGGDKASYTYVEPSSTENTRLADESTRQQILEQRDAIARDFEKATLTWIASGGVKDERNRLAESLRENYWMLDPYVRARSIYDRTGVIKEGGRLDFYPAKSPTEHANGHAVEAAEPKTNGIH